MSELTRRYAQALYQVCPDEDGLRETAGALMGDAALWEALTSPAVEPEEKGRVLARLPALDGHGLLLRFYRLLASKGRMALLPAILKDFHGAALADRGCARCVITCARAPGEEELGKLRRPVPAPPQEGHPVRRPGGAGAAGGLHPGHRGRHL